MPLLWSIVDDVRLLAECAYCLVPITENDRSKRTPQGYAHECCPDSHECETCGNRCLEGRVHREEAVAFCCRCTWESEKVWRLALGQRYQPCEICAQAASGQEVKR